MFAISEQPAPPSPFESSPVLGSARRITGAVVFCCGILLIVGSHLAAALADVLSLLFLFPGYGCILAGAGLVASPAVAETMIRGLKKKLHLIPKVASRKDASSVPYIAAFLFLMIVLSLLHYSFFFSPAY